MEEILDEFEKFLETIIRNYLIPGSKGTIPGIMGKELKISTFSYEYDTQVSNKINEIINDEHLKVDKEQLKNALIEKANEVYQIFTADTPE